MPGTLPGADVGGEQLGRGVRVAVQRGGYVRVRRVRPSGTAVAQQVRQRGAEPERHHRQARHEHHHRPRRPGRARGGQQVVDDLAEHAERQGADRRPAGERRARSGVPGVSHAPSAYAPYASTPTGSVIAVFSCRPSQMPGSGCMTPNPHMPPRPTQPDQTATAAGAAIRNRRPLRGALMTAARRDHLRHAPGGTTRRRRTRAKSSSYGPAGRPHGARAERIHGAGGPGSRRLKRDAATGALAWTQADDQPRDVRGDMRQRRGPDPPGPWATVVHPAVSPWYSSVSQRCRGAAPVAVGLQRPVGGAERLGAGPAPGFEVAANHCRT